ncbi:hypothetical protein HanIR_Chr08g0344111 [Helianthus annuus]|nr:hypothetical protein HanIR_Chr08g0344111 [Helianthus annuus]
MQNYYRAGGLIGSRLSIPTGRGKAVYILPSSDRTFALLLVGFTEYDDDDDTKFLTRAPNKLICTSNLGLTLQTYKDSQLN